MPNKSTKKRKKTGPLTADSDASTATVRMFCQGLGDSFLITLPQGDAPRTDGRGGLTPEFLVKTINTFMEARSQLKTSPVPQLPLELSILELIHG